MHPLDLFKFCPQCGSAAFQENCCTYTGTVVYAEALNVKNRTVHNYIVISVLWIILSF